MVEYHLGGEGARLDEAPLLQLEQVAAVSQYRAVRQPSHDAARHADLTLAFLGPERIKHGAIRS